MAPTSCCRKEKEKRSKLARCCCFFWRRPVCCSEGGAVLLPVPSQKNTTTALISSSSDHHHYDDRKLFKKYSQRRSKTFPINTSDFAIMSSHNHLFENFHSAKTSKTEVKGKSSKLAAPPVPALLQTISLKQVQNINNLDQESKNLADYNARRRQLFNKESSSISGRETNWSKPIIKVSHDYSVLSMNKEKARHHAQTRKAQCNELTVAGGGAFDPMVGALIVLLALAVMLIWGKVCAILFAAAWFYFLPRLIRRPNHDDIINESYIINNSSSTQMDLDSAEHKKKVVLQGFLERN